MSGHSQFKNIMYRKGAQDKKRGKVFTKLIRELTTAARSGLPDPNGNPRLRAAILAARQANMPKDTVERAIKRGAGAEGGEAYDEVRYEGYGPGGIAVIVEALTDNRNRTASEVRAAFTKSGGASDVESDDDGHVVFSAPEDLNSARDALEQRFGPANSARLAWRPKTATMIDEEIASGLFKLIETLEDSDDVQNVYGNFEVG